MGMVKAGDNRERAVAAAVVAAAAAADEEDCGGKMTKVSGDVQFNLFCRCGGCFRLSFTCVGLRSFQFGELVSQCSLAILAGETAIYVGTCCDSM